MSLIEVEHQLAHLRDRAAEINRRHEVELAEISDQFVKASKTRARLLAGINDEQVALARSVLAVFGSYANGGEDRKSVLRDATAAILAGGGGLREEFFGTKNYDRWAGQRCDCFYGMGPKHGSICFSIGIRGDRLKDKFSGEEIEACLYFLGNFEEIEAAEREAAAA